MLKQIVKNSLELRGVDPKILASVDTLIQRSILRLSQNDFIPPRTWEFTSADEKNVKQVGDRTVAYYKLPDDFRTLDSFYVYDSYPYYPIDDLESLIQKEVQAERGNIDEPKRYFTIYHENFDSDDKAQKWLVATPFPASDDEIRLRYHSNGNCTTWTWIDEPYWEAVISEVESILGLTSQQEAEEQRSKAVKASKELKGSNSGQGFTRIRSSYFGGKARKVRRQDITDNNL